MRASLAVLTAALLAGGAACAGSVPGTADPSVAGDPHAPAGAQSAGDARPPADPPPLAGDAGPAALPPSPAPRFVGGESPARHVRIDEGIEPDSAIEAMIAPYRERMAEELAAVLAHATGDFFKSDPEGELDNLVADAVFSAVQGLASDTVHAVLLNDGGLRVPVAAGPILMRHAYELLPFENYVTVLSLSGGQMERLADEVAASGGEPIAGWTLEIEGRDAVNVRIGGQAVDPDRTYRLATVDYLVQGGGTWSVLWESGAAPREDLAILIRDVFVAYLRGQGAVTPALDGRIRRVGGGDASARESGRAGLEPMRETERGWR